jgi:hypothetical protein
MPSLDDRFDQIDRRFDRVDRDLGELRTEMRAGFAELRQSCNRLNISLWVAFIGLVATILARGA